MSIFHCIVVLGGFAALSDAVKLPPYITPCSRNDPNLSECALKKARLAMTSGIVETGDRKYNVPVMDPVKIVALDMTLPGFSVEHRNVTFSGLKNAIFTAARIDLKKRHQEFDAQIPLVEILAIYKISGKILVLPISGSGKLNMTISNVKVTLAHDFDLKKKKNGKSYMQIKNTRIMNPQTSKMTISMENLFNGDKLLGDNMNRFLNENWEELHKDLGPFYYEAIAQVAHQMYEGFTSNIPYDEIYPERV